MHRLSRFFSSGLTRFLCQPGGVADTDSQDPPGSNSSPICCVLSQESHNKAWSGFHMSHQSDSGLGTVITINCIRECACSHGMASVCKISTDIDE